MHLVFLALEASEKTANALVALVAVHDEPPLLGGEILPWHVEPYRGRAGRTFQLGEIRAVVRLGPRLNGALLDRLGRVGDHQVHIQLDDVAKSMARRARTERVVEREQPRLRRLVGQVTGSALEPLRELEPFPHVRTLRARIAWGRGPKRPWTMPVIAWRRTCSATRAIWSGHRAPPNQTTK